MYNIKVLPSSTSLCDGTITVHFNKDTGIIFSLKRGYVLPANIPPSSQSIWAAVVLNLTDLPHWRWANGLGANVLGRLLSQPSPFLQVNTLFTGFSCHLECSLVLSWMKAGERYVWVCWCVLERQGVFSSIYQTRKMRFRSLWIRDWGDVTVREIVCQIRKFLISSVEHKRWIFENCPGHFFYLRNVNGVSRSQIWLY